MNSTVCGVGINDWGRPVTFNKKAIWEYRLWKNMIARCFDSKLKSRYTAYQDVTCCKEWLSMSSFIKDIKCVPNFEKYIYENWEIDKDILVKGNNIYSKDTVCFVPKEINCLLTNSKKTRGELPIGLSIRPKTGKYQVRTRLNGKEKYLGVFTNINEAFAVYKSARESEIKRVADKWKNQLDSGVYEALSNWRIDITD